MPITALKSLFLKTPSLCWCQSQRKEPQKWVHRMTNIAWNLWMAQGVLAETNTHEGSRDNARMKRWDKVEFEINENVSRMVDNHSETVHIHVFPEEPKSHGASSDLTGTWVWFEVCWVQDKDRCLLLLLLHAAAGPANMAATVRRCDLDLVRTAT